MRGSPRERASDPLLASTRSPGIALDAAQGLPCGRMISKGDKALQDTPQKSARPTVARTCYLGRGRSNMRLVAMWRAATVGSRQLKGAPMSHYEQRESEFESESALEGEEFLGNIAGMIGGLLGESEGEDELESAIREAESESEGEFEGELEGELEGEGEGEEF